METQSKTMLEMGNVGQYNMDAPTEFTGLASDSRDVRPGYLFAALPGTRADGGAFLAEAVGRGAVIEVDHGGALVFCHVG